MASNASVSEYAARRLHDPARKRPGQMGLLAARRKLHTPPTGSAPWPVQIGAADTAGRQAARRRQTSSDRDNAARMEKRAVPVMTHPLDKIPQPPSSDPTAQTHPPGRVASNPSGKVSRELGTAADAPATLWTNLVRFRRRGYSVAAI